LPHVQYLNQATAESYQIPPKSPFTTYCTVPFDVTEA
jgi:hypothetical protein